MTQTAFKTKKVAAGTLIIETGAPAERAYMILSGTVEVTLEKEGKTVTLARLEKGAMFGETALFGAHEYGANVTALTDTDLRIITKDNFRTEIEQCDPMMHAIIDMLIERLRKTNQALLESETRSFMDIDFI